MKFWWNDYVGIPYLDRGRDRSGADCWGLARLVYREQQGIELPSFDGLYANANDGAVDEIVAMEREGWTQHAEPAEGHLVLFRILGRESHVGVYIGEGKFLHAREGHAACIERLDSGAWRHRIAGFFAYTGGLTLNGIPHPLRTERLEVTMPAGSTLSEVVAWVRQKSPVEIKAELVLMLDGKVIPSELWGSITTVPGQRIEYRAVPRGGDVGRALLSIAVVVGAMLLAPYVSPYVASTFGVSASTALALSTAALTFAGTLLLNAIFPVRPPKTNDPGQTERQNLLQGGSNQGNPYGSIPVVLGRFRYTPPLGAQSYVEASARESYLRMLMVWGYGPLQISDLRIGATPLDTLEEVEYATLTGYDDTAEDVAQFKRLYGRDVSQQYFGTELECLEYTVSSASRTSNVVTVNTSTAHTYSSGQTVDLYLSAGGTISGVITVTGASSFTFPNTGTNGSISATVCRMQPWTEHTISDQCDNISVTLHFPEGLRRIVMEGRYAGATSPTAFRGVVQVRQLDPNTLAPLTSWGDIDKTYPGGVVNLQPAWFNIDNDEALEPVYRWTRLSLDANSKLVIRTGAFTASPNAEPSGNLLLRQQQAAFGVGVTYNRLPDYGPGEEPLWDICMFGSSVYTSVDRRDGSVTGAGLSISGIQATLASATITRADSDTIRYGGDGEPYANRKDAFSATINFSVAAGVYQVRVRRTNQSLKEFTFPSGNKGQRYHTCQLMTITGYENRRPVVQPSGVRLAMTALRVRASNQINGNLDGISGTVQVLCKDYDSGTGTWVVRPTRNPASLLRHVLQHPGNAQRVADSQIDLVGLQDWHTYCRTNAFMFDAVVTDQQSLLDTLRDIASAGRASPTLRDGKWAVVIDKPRTSIAQHFTPHNSWGFEGARALPKLPHGFRVQFNNAEKGYQPDEMIVYNDGYSSANATLFEALQLPGVTTTRAIFKHARFHLAQLKLRPETYTLNADIEHLICQRGDLVRVTHDVPMWGLGTGRIKNRVSGTVLELDEQMPMDAGVQYTIRIRLEDGSSITRTVASVGTDGYYSTITLTTSVTTTEGAPGNLFLFGSLSSESTELVVQSIEPSENMTARLTLVDYSPAVYDSDSETIPAFDSKITLPPKLLQTVITRTPTISQIISDERAMEYLGEGRYAYRIQVAFTNPVNLPSNVTGIEGQIDYAGDTALVWSTTQLFRAADRSVVFTDVEKGAQYRLRLRYVGDDGRTGPWTATQLHTVSGKNLPPGTITDLSVSIVGDMLKLDWADAPEPDAVAYEVRTADSGWGDMSRVFRGDVSQCMVVPAAVGVSRTWYVKAIDATGLYSTTAASISYTVAALPNISAITETFADTSLTNATITLDWVDVTPALGLSGYEVSYPGVTKVVSASTITLPANWLGDRTFTVKTIDQRGNKSSGFSKTITKLAPNPVTNLRAQVIDNNVLLYWTLPSKTTLPVQDVIVKKGATWAGALTIGTKDGGFTSLQELAAGTYTYWVAVRDTDNNQSTPVSVSARVSEPPDFVFHGEFTSAFAGTLSSAIVENASVVLPVNTTETWAQHFTTRSWNTPADQIAAGFPVFIQPGTASGHYQEVFDFGTILASSQVTVAYSGEVAGGTPIITVSIETSDNGTTWTPAATGTSAFATQFRYVRVRVTVAGDGDEIYRLNSLTCRLDAKLRNDAGLTSAVSTDASGTVANFSKEFIDVTSITVSPSSTTPVTAVYDFQDAVLSGTYSVTSNVATVNVTGHGLVVGQNVRLAFSTGTAPSGIYTVASVPSANQFTVSITTANTSGNVQTYPQGIRIYLFNSAGSRVSGTVSWSIKGY